MVMGEGKRWELMSVLQKVQSLHENVIEKNSGDQLINYHFLSQSCPLAFCVPRLEFYLTKEEKEEHIRE